VALAAGIPLVVVTHGEHGAVASTPLGSATVEAPKVPVVDTVGAGDAFMSGALAHLHERGLLNHDALRSLDTQGIEQMLQDACRIASHTCTRAGADPPRRRDLYSGAQGGPQVVILSFDDLVERARALALRGQRHLLGITGAPGRESQRSRVSSSISSAPIWLCSFQWTASISAITF
jgi:hypothetical protein